VGSYLKVMMIIIIIKSYQHFPKRFVQGHYVYRVLGMRTKLIPLWAQITTCKSVSSGFFVEKYLEDLDLNGKEILK
jgi:hypothetical protein